MGIMKGKSAYDYYKAGKYDKAAALWLPQANKGGVDVQYNLACCYMNLGQTRRGEYWLERAAKSGDREAQEDLAEMYFDGTFEQDLDKSLYYCIEAAKKNSIRAKKLIVKLVDPVAKSGSDDSKYFIAYCCLSGKHMDANEEKGFEIMEELAAKGRADAGYFMDIKNDVPEKKVKMILTHKQGGDYGYLFCMMQWQIKIIMGKVFKDAESISVKRLEKKAGKIYVKYPDEKYEVQYEVNDFNIKDVNASEDKAVTKEQILSFRDMMADMFGDSYVRDYLFAADAITVVTDTDKYVKQLNEQQIIDTVQYLAFKNAVGAVISENYENSSRVVVEVARKDEKIIDKFLITDYSCTLLDADENVEVDKANIAAFRVKMFEIFGMDYAKEFIKIV